MIEAAKYLGWYLLNGLFAIVLAASSLLLYIIYVLTGCRSKKVLALANSSAEIFIAYILLPAVASYYKNHDKGDTWLKD